MHMIDPRRLLEHLSRAGEPEVDEKLQRELAARKRAILDDVKALQAKHNIDALVVGVLLNVPTDNGVGVLTTEYSHGRAPDVIFMADTLAKVLHQRCS